VTRPSRPQETATRAPLGLLGGTFDPVHYGHLRLAEEAGESLGLARVQWIPAGNPGHRAAPGTPARHRLEMVRLAVRDNPRFAVDDAEALGETPRFTIDTLRRLRAELGTELPLVLVIGADQLHRLDTWREWRELFDHAHFAVAERPGYAVTPTALPAAVAAEWRRRAAARAALRDAPAGRTTVFALTALAISASDIRRRLAAGESVRYLLPPEVLAYIRTHRLYSEDTKAS
jgi:nicotinate-nucleotide adenylyltransferase